MPHILRVAGCRKVDVLLIAAFPVTYVHTYWGHDLLHCRWDVDNFIKVFARCIFCIQRGLDTEQALR